MTVTFVAPTERAGEVNKALTGGRDADIIGNLLLYNNVAKLLERKTNRSGSGTSLLVHSRLPSDHIEATFEIVTRLYSDPKRDMVRNTLWPITPSLTYYSTSPSASSKETGESLSRA